MFLSAWYVMKAYMYQILVNEKGNNGFAMIEIMLYIFLCGTKKIFPSYTSTSIGHVYKQLSKLLCSAAVSHSSHYN